MSYQIRASVSRCMVLSVPHADETKALNVCRILAGTMQPRVPRPPEVVQQAA